MKFIRRIEAGQIWNSNQRPNLINHCSLVQNVLRITWIRVYYYRRRGTWERLAIHFTSELNHFLIWPKPLYSARFSPSHLISESSIILCSLRGCNGDVFWHNERGQCVSLNSGSGEQPLQLYQSWAHSGHLKPLYCLRNDDFCPKELNKASAGGCVFSVRIKQWISGGVNFFYTKICKEFFVSFIIVQVICGVHQIQFTKCQINRLLLKQTNKQKRLVLC